MNERQLMIHPTKYVNKVKINMTSMMSMLMMMMMMNMENTMFNKNGYHSKFTLFTHFLLKQPTGY